MLKNILYFSFFTHFTHTTSFLLSRVRNPTAYHGTNEELPPNEKDSIDDDILDHIYEDVITQAPVKPLHPLKYNPLKSPNRSSPFWNNKNTGTNIVRNDPYKLTKKFTGKQTSIDKDFDDLELQSVMLRPALEFKLPKYEWNDVDSYITTMISSTTQVLSTEQSQYDPWPTMLGLPNIPWQTRATVLPDSPKTTSRIWPTLWPKFNFRRPFKANNVKFVIKNETEDKPILRAPTLISKCYECGLSRIKLEDGIPTDSDCNNIFSSPSYSDRAKIDETKRHCFFRDNETIAYNGNAAYGRFSGGCFKRYLEIGTVYTERGCRTVPYGFPGDSIISPRFVRLQYLLDDTKEGCVISPFAIFTPFSKAISLFVRYHVCVCEKDYCNKANLIQGNLIYVFIFNLLYLYYLYIL